MTLSQISKRLFIFAGAVVLGSTTTIAIPMANAASTPYYKVELAKPVQSQRIIMRGTSLKCVNTSCAAKKANSSARNMCVLVAREFGEVTSFKAGKREFDAAALEKCNGDKKAQAKRAELEKLATN